MFINSDFENLSLKKIALYLKQVILKEKKI